MKKQLQFLLLCAIMGVSFNFKVFANDTISVCIGDSVNLLEINDGGSWTLYGTYPAIKIVDNYLIGISTGSGTIMYSTKVSGVYTLYYVIVKANPTFDIDADFASLEECEGSSTQYNLKDQVENLDMTATFSYSGDGVTDGVFSAADLTSGTNPVYFTATSTDGCSTTDTANVTIMALPDAPEAYNTPVCYGENDTIILTNVGSNSIAWENSSGASMASSYQLIVPSVTSDDAYYATYTDENGCKSTSTIKVTVDAIEAAFTVGATVAEVGESVQFTSTSTNASTYEWDFSEGTTSSDENPSYSFTSAGYKDVSLLVTSSNGCSDEYSLDSAIYVTSKIEGNSAVDLTGSSAGFELYPLPMNDELTVVNNAGKSATLSIFSVDGRLVMSEVLAIDVNTVDVSSLSSGSYVVKISGENINQSRQIIKL